MLLVGAPGRMRNGKRLPPVTSRTKKFASLPAMSQVCGVVAGGAGLFEAYRRRITAVDVEVEDRRRGAKADVAGAGDEKRIGRRARRDPERLLAAGDIVEGEKVGAAGRTVVGGDLPVVARERSRHWCR